MQTDETKAFVRKYLLDGEETVEIRVWPPRLESDEIETWKCEHHIIGVGGGRKSHTFGGDAIQALYLGLMNVSTTLYASEEYKSGRLRWFGGMTKFDLALPVVEIIRADVEADRKALEEAAG